MTDSTQPPASSKPTQLATEATRTALRQSEQTRLLHELLHPREQLSVLSISGPGGVGKSYLMAQVLEQLEPAAQGYLLLRADAANPETRSDLLGLLEGQLFRRSLEPPADPARDHFPQLRDITEQHRAISQQALSELVKRGAPEPVQRAAKLLLRTGRVLNRTASPLNLGNLAALSKVASASEILDEKLVSESLDVAWDLLRDLNELRDSTSLPGPLRDLFGITRKNRIKRDFYSLLAGVIRSDVAAALSGYEPRDSKRLTHGKIHGLDKLLLVLDDYEAVQDLLGDFLIGALLPSLASAPFRSQIVIIGRDDLRATHPGWEQHGKRYLRESIRLSPFDRDSTMRLLRESQVPSERHEALYQATQGFPFLLSLVIEEQANEGDSVVFLRRFFDRITRWMSPQERSWFVRVCYLERIDEDTLSALFSAEEVPQVQEWFEREPSIRDPQASVFQVRPMVREKVLRYLSIRQPSRHREQMAKAASTRSEIS